MTRRVFDQGEYTAHIFSHVIIRSHHDVPFSMNPHLFYPKDASLESRPGGQGRGKSASALNNALTRLQLGNQCVTVIGVIGKSMSGKGKFINTLLDRPVFQVCVV